MKRFGNGATLRYETLASENPKTERETMNSKRKLMTAVWVLAFVAVAAFVSVRGVTAAHPGVARSMGWTTQEFVQRSGSDDSAAATSQPSSPARFEQVASGMGWTLQEFVQRSGIQ